MRHPAEYWIKYLITRKHGFDEIKGMAEMVDLGGVTSEYLRGLSADVKREMPIPFRARVNGSSNRPTGLDFIKKHEIYSMWNPDRYMREAEALLSDGRIRAYLETYILSPLTSEQAVEKIKEVTSSKVSQRAYELFRHYYWNSSLLNITEWGEYMRIRRAAHNDWLKCALAAQGPQGVQMVLWRTKAGALRHLDAGKIFTDIRNIAYMKIKEVEFEKAGVKNSATMSNYTKVAKLSQDEINNSAEAMEDILKSFQAFQMMNKQEELPSVSQLTSKGGTISEAEDVAGSEEKLEY